MDVSKLSNWQAAPLPPSSVINGTGTRPGSWEGASAAEQGSCGPSVQARYCKTI